MNLFEMKTYFYFKEMPTSKSTHCAIFAIVNHKYFNKLEQKAYTKELTR